VCFLAFLQRIDLFPFIVMIRKVLSLCLLLVSGSVFGQLVDTKRNIVNDKAFKDWRSMSDHVLAAHIGAFVKHHRLEQNKTQDVLSHEAGISRSTLSLLERGNSVHEMIQVAGEEGVTLQDFVIYQQAIFVDMVYLQQDAFDEVDVSVPMERQKQMFMLIKDILMAENDFSDQNQARNFYTRLTGLFRNLNYSIWQSTEYKQLLDKILTLKQTS
jgi:transcriptional regulator with XRE-family HTH domain